ncbi:MAG: hypothetical protein NTY75_04610 [Candidatus Shapirobacteria bacterium]|nr:hypothetical protein [Candidatus Shapirobacteria bacterium]
MKKNLFVFVSVIVLSALILTGCQNPRAEKPGVWYNPFSWGDHTLVQSLKSGCVQGATSTVINGSTYACPNAQVTTDLAAPVIVDNSPALMPQITPDNTFEVKCEHKNAGKFFLPAGYSVNGGHVWVNGQEFLFVDDKVVVVTNNSNGPVEISSTDGVGMCNDVDFSRQVTMRFSEGCDQNGCSAVLWVNVDKDGKITSKTINKDPQ